MSMTMEKQFSDFSLSPDQIFDHEDFEDLRYVSFHFLNFLSDAYGSIITTDAPIIFLYVLMLYGKWRQLERYFKF